jgi:hypothetical protein
MSIFTCCEREDETKYFHPCACPTIDLYSISRVFSSTPSVGRAVRGTYSGDTLYATITVGSESSPTSVTTSDFFSSSGTASYNNSGRTRWHSRFCYRDADQYPQNMANPSKQENNFGFRASNLGIGVTYKAILQVEGRYIPSSNCFDSLGTPFDYEREFIFTATSSTYESHSIPSNWNSLTGEQRWSAASGWYAMPSQAGFSYGWNGSAVIKIEKE